jgi:Spy/CpxP family protein refolding chaperone
MTDRTKAIVTLGGVFLLGAICGALTLGLVVRNRVREAQSLKDREGFEQYFADRLRLTEVQRDSLKDELDRTYEELAGLRRSTADEYHELLDTFAQRISPQLSAEQRDLLRREEQHFRGAIPRERINPPEPERSTSAPRREESTMPRTTSPGKPPVDSTPSRKPDRRPMAVATPNDSVASNVPELPPGSNLEPGDAFQPEQLAETYRDRLKLTDDQSRQVRQIVRQTHSRIKRAREELKDYPMMLGAAMRRNLREMDSRIVDLLTPEQLPEYRVMRQELKAKLKSRWEEMRQKRKETRNNENN